jgi:rare lipoprotein A
MYLRSCVAITLVAILLAGCAHKKHARRIPPPPAPPAAPRPGYTETGVASWYGRPYHGRPAANGEVYDM